ncbi:MAG TPA: TRZ/ATZ family hydrolase [Marinobacter sp.]|nr:TRZ/ATZ family hydrolase [Marinobacter sp.]
MTAQTITAADTRINARWLIPIEPFGVVLEHQAVILQGNRILAVVPAATADHQFRTRETLNLDQHVVMPGLINLHGHTAMSLFRGLADDLPLMDWLNNHIWPAEARFVSEPFVLDGSRLAMAEMLRTGTTTFSDMYFFPEITAQLAHDIGMRAQVCFPLLDHPSPWGSGPEEYLRKGAELIRHWRNDSFVMPAVGPHAPYTVSDRWLAAGAELAGHTGVALQIHLHETAFEVEQALQSTGKRPVSRLAELGVLGQNSQYVHMTQIDDADLAHLTQSGGHVVHCPESNLKLASGFCPVQQLAEHGINMTIGTDGAASNNDLDLFGELKTAAMLAKAVAGNAAAVSAHHALAMATLNGARALGRDHELGSLVAGKLADLIAVDLGDPFIQPVYDPASHLVYSNHGRAVSHSWINGVPQVQNGELTRIDVPDLTLRVREWRNKILS